jgi:hypothetical protein
VGHILQLNETLPAEFQGNLPGIDEIEAALTRVIALRESGLTNESNRAKSKTRRNPLPKDDNVWDPASALKGF